ncbi:MAG TPA: hypothetical protein VK762_25165, partial [Polyangiaceae bacterium]|nr:hypothetical protein [Polyangiaceae bacterium]
RLNTICDGSPAPESLRALEGETLRCSGRCSGSGLGALDSNPCLAPSPPAPDAGATEAAAGEWPSIIVAVGEICGLGGNCERARGGASGAEGAVLWAGETGCTGGSTDAGGALWTGATDGALWTGATAAGRGGATDSDILGGAADGLTGSGRDSSGALRTS